MVQKPMSRIAEAWHWVLQNLNYVAVMAFLCMSGNSSNYLQTKMGARQNSIFESRFHHKICITVTPEVEDKDIQCFVPNFQYNSPANMQISMIIISMRTILLVNTFKYIFLIIRLLLPSSTSVSTSLSKEGSK